MKKAIVTDRKDAEENAEEDIAKYVPIGASAMNQWPYGYGISADINCIFLFCFSGSDGEYGSVSVVRMLYC